jgi:hypothetical protein
MAQDEIRNPVDRLVTADLDESAGIGKPLSRRTRQKSRALEDYLKAGGPPRWMERIGQIDRGIAREKRRLEREYRHLRRRHGRDHAGFAAAWRERAAAQRFDELNVLIGQHNDWYPIERDLPMDPRTKDYVRVHGRSYRRPLLTAEWVLEQFPA